MKTSVEASVKAFIEAMESSTDFCFADASTDYP